MKLTWTYEGAIEYAEARGTSLITRMNSWLLKSNRSDELTRSFEDSTLQQKLLAEYQMTHPAATSIS